MDCASTFNTPGRPRIALGTARTWSSLSSSGVSILIRLGRLLEGETREPPPLEARASIVLLLRNARGRECAPGAPAISSLATAAADAATENVAGF